LVADIGGTNARFGWVPEPGAAVSNIQTLSVADFHGPAEAAKLYLSGVRQAFGHEHSTPHSASFAVATALNGDWVQFTNNAWAFSRHELREKLAVDRFEVCNDFEALALSLPFLQPHQMRHHADWPVLEAASTQTRAVVGPGTGLGVAGLAHVGNRWYALPGEGGHVTLSPANASEWAIIEWVSTEFAHVSAERLLCGSGLVLLHRAVCAVHGVAAPDVQLQPSNVVQQAELGQALALQSVQHFCAMLGGVCGNAALTFGARGGLYVGGGIVPKLGNLFDAATFRARFEAKGRFSAYLQTIPTPIIVDTLASLAGAASLLQSN
jgi:glucokinase